MSKASTIYKALVFLLAVSMLLTACAPAVTPTQAPPAATNPPAPAATNPPAPAATNPPAPAATQPPSNAQLPVLDWYFLSYVYKDSGLNAVQDAVNKIIGPAIGAQVKFHIMDYQSQTQNPAVLMLNAQQPCDLINFSQFIPFSPAVTTGGLIPLDDLLKQNAPQTYAAFTPDQWSAVKFNGKIMGALVWTGSQIGKAAMWYRQDLITKYNFDWQKATKLTDWEPLFDNILKGEGGKVIPLLSSDPYWGRAWFPMLWGYDPISESIGAPKSRGMVGVKVDDMTRKVVPVAWTPEYLQAVTLNRNWYLKGYYPKTVPPDAEMGVGRAAGKYGGFYFVAASYFSNDAMAANEWNNVPIVTGFVQDKAVLTTSSLAGSEYGVCATSKHPDLAVKFIEQMNTNVDLINLMNFGIKDKNWVWADEANKVITYPPGVDAKSSDWNPNMYWQFGNRNNMYLTSKADLGVFPKIAAATKDAIASPILGFNPDLSTIENEVAQVSSAAKQFCDPVDDGLVDVTTGLKACQDALKTAGIDTIVTELQKQVDAWAKANGK